MNNTKYIYEYWNKHSCIDVFSKYSFIWKTSRIGGNKSNIKIKNKVELHDVLLQVLDTTNRFEVRTRYPNQNEKLNLLTVFVLRFSFFLLMEVIIYWVPFFGMRENRVETAHWVSWMETSNLKAKVGSVSFQVWKPQILWKHRNSNLKNWISEF